MDAVLYCGLSVNVSLELTNNQLCFVLFWDKHLDNLNNTSACIHSCSQKRDKETKKVREIGLKRRKWRKSVL